MRTLARLPQWLSTEFTPRLDGISLSGLSASCSNGIVTISWDELPVPHDDKSQSSITATEDDFNDLNSYSLEIFILSGFTSGSALSYPLLATNFSGYVQNSVINLDNDFLFYDTPTNINNETGLALTGTAGSSGYGTGLSQGNLHINWSTRSASVDISSYNATNTTPIWKFNSKLVSGNARIYVKPRYRANVSQFIFEFASARYSGNWSNVDVSLSGPNISAPISATPVSGYSISGRTISWSDSTTMASYFIYVYKWNGSAWVALRNGYLADNFTGGTGTGDQSYTIPAGDGSGSFYISVSTYSPYSNSFSAYASSTSYTL